MRPGSTAASNIDKLIFEVKEMSTYYVSRRRQTFSVDVAFSLQLCKSMPFSHKTLKFGIFHAKIFEYAPWANFWIFSLRAERFWGFWEALFSSCLFNIIYICGQPLTWPILVMTWQQHWLDWLPNFSRRCLILAQ